MRGEYERRRPQRRENKKESKERRWSPPGRERGKYVEGTPDYTGGKEA
jgi:hypothetical protein